MKISQKVLVRGATFLDSDCMYGASKYRGWYRDVSGLRSIYEVPFDTSFFSDVTADTRALPQYGTAFRQPKCLGIPANPGSCQITVVSDHDDGDDDM